MSETSTDAFLSGQGIPVPLPELDAELARLWGPSAEREGGPDLDRPAVTRVVLANLVVASPEPGHAPLDPLLETVAAHYPCRAIVLRRAESPGRRVAAEVAAICHLPAPGLPQICSERITLTAGSDALDMLPGAVRPLLETDLPLVLWWVGDPRPAHRIFLDLAAESSRLILDLPDPDADPQMVRAALDLTTSRYGRDVAWFGTTPWRELVAQFFDPPGAEKRLEQIDRVEIAVAAPTADRPSRAGCWLAAWLAGRLGWEAMRVRAASGGGRDAVFSGPSGEVAVSIRTAVAPGASPPHPTGVTLTTRDGGLFQLSRPAPEGADVLVESSQAGAKALPRLIRASEWDAARRVSAALESARDDPPYRAALPHMLWLLEAGRA